MKSILNYQVFLSSIARKQYKLHDIKQEWKAFILFIFLAKVLTWSISVFAGTNYFTLLLYPVLQHTVLTISVAILVLIIIEVLTTIALSKFFKFLFRGINYTTTIIVLAFVVLGLFGISFISSTNGLAMRQAKKVDNTELIIERNSLQKQQTKNEYKSRFADIDKQITLIENNPQGWTGGKRTILLKHQSSKIDSLLVVKSKLLQEQKTEIIQLNTAKQAEMNVNKQQTTAEADKYYKIIMVVMIVQFISSGMLMFFFKRIWHEEDKQGVFAEQAKELKAVYDANAYNLQIDSLNDSANYFAVEFEKERNKQFAIPINQAEHEEEKKQVIGFNNRTKKPVENQLKKPVKQPDKKISGHSSRLNNSNDFTMHIHSKDIAYLKKHKPIVKGIKLLKIPEKESISNPEIKQVQQVVKRAKQKGRTTIQNVYRVAVTVGLNKIDNNGNVTF